MKFLRKEDENHIYVYNWQKNISKHQYFEIKTVPQAASKAAEKMVTVEWKCIYFFDAVIMK